MLEQNLISYLILDLARIGADSDIRVLIGKMFFSEIHRISIRPQIEKNVHFAPYPLSGSTISEDLPM